MTNEENNVNVLDELNKGACMGKDAIFFLLDKVKDTKLSATLHDQYEDYLEILKTISEIYPEYSDEKPHKTNTMNKMMTWYGLEMRTMMDASDSKITELMLQGTNMGIIEGRKLLNHKAVDKKIHAIAEKYVSMQEIAVEKLKTFL